MDACHIDMPLFLGDCSSLMMEGSHRAAPPRPTPRDTFQEPTLCVMRLVFPCSNGALALHWGWPAKALKLSPSSQTGGRGHISQRHRQIWATSLPRGVCWANRPRDRRLKGSLSTVTLYKRPKRKKTKT